MASSPDELIYVDNRLRTRRRSLTPREIETLRRRGIRLRRLGWALTIPAWFFLEWLMMTLAWGSRPEVVTMFLLIVFVVLYGLSKFFEASRHLISVQAGAEVIEHESVSGAVESVLLPAARVIQHGGRNVTFPRPIAVKHIAYVPQAIVSAQQELLASGSVRGERPLTEAEFRELERIRDSSVRPQHWVVGAFYTAAHIPFLCLIFYWTAPGACLVFTVATLVGGLVALFYTPLRRRSQAKKALLNGTVTVVSRELTGADLELLPDSKTPWTQNSQPARWRYD